ncbi:MAG: nicotinate-nucleotide adenylyltransferase [Chloroflexales bacterium]
MTSAQRIGIYGGSFDPIHIGHLATAEDARHALGLDHVIFVPASRQPLKADFQGASPDQRLAMVSLACRENPRFVASDVDLRRPPPSYTVDTLAVLRAETDPGADLVFILGADAARDLPRWHRATEIIRLVRLAIVGRPGYHLNLAQLEADLPGISARCTTVTGPRLEISSSELRARIVSGRPARYQIPDPVLAYIVEHGLYREHEHGHP